MDEKIRLLGISASPRKGGNSTFLLEQALEAAKSFEHAKVEVEKIEFAEKKVAPCLACYGCIDKKGQCVIQDDFQAIRSAWLRSDAVLYSVPVFAMSIPAQLKCFFDRLCNTLVFDEKVSSKKLKVVGTIAQGMHFAAGQEGVIREITNISVLLGCIPVAGSGYNAYDGVRGWTFGKLSRSTYKKRFAEGDVATKELVEEVKLLVRDLLYIALIVRSGARVCQNILREVPDYASILHRIEEGQE